MTHAKHIIKSWSADTGRRIGWLAAQARMGNVHLSKCMAGLHVPGPEFRAALAELTGETALADVATWGRME